MKVFKKFALFTVATIADLLLIIWSLDTFGFRSPVSAFLVNWFAMSWVATASLIVHFSLPLRYYDIKAFERTGQIYERLGIRLFKRLMRRGPLSIFSRQFRLPKEKTISALRHLDHEMRNAETIHVFIFMLMLSFISYDLLKGWFDAVGWMLAFNVIINGYPIMLQRYNRIKLQELVHKEDSGLIGQKETQEIHGGSA